MSTQKDAFPASPFDWSLGETTAFATFQIQDVKQSSTFWLKTWKSPAIHTFLLFVSSLAAPFQVFPNSCYAWQDRKRI